MVATNEPDGKPSLESMLLQWDRWIWQVVNRIVDAFDLDRDEVRQEVLAEIVGWYGWWDPSIGAFSTYVGLMSRRCYWRYVRERRQSIKTVNIDCDNSSTGRLEGAKPDSDFMASRVADLDVPDPADAAARRETIERVRAALGELPDDEVTAVMQWAGEAARPNRISEAAARATERGLARLRELLRAAD